MKRREGIEEDVVILYLLLDPIQLQLEFTGIVREIELETSFSRVDWVFSKHDPMLGKVFSSDNSSTEDG